MGNEEEYAMLDNPRIFGNEQLDREVIEEYGSVTPYSEDRDEWCTMPVRLCWDQAGGLQIELGAYTLGGRDIDLVVSAIGRYYAVDMEMRAAAGSDQPDG
jgi:hypothetical protein